MTVQQGKEPLPYRLPAHMFLLAMQGLGSEETILALQPDLIIVPDYFDRVRQPRLSFSMKENF